MVEKKTKIVCTVSDRNCSPEFIESLYKEGMNVVRINSAHTTLESSLEIVKNVRKISDKIAILIDDVTTQAQKDKILSMGYKINMAFLPPTSGHPNSAKIAQNLSFHMIHFPMQTSSAFKGKEVNTLKITDSAWIFIDIKSAGP